MTIAQLHVLRGPNFWSIGRPQLIEMLLDLQELEHQPSNEIPGFYERLVALMPSLYTHRCSEDFEGGFLYRVKTGTWMGHIIEHIALELQSLTDMETGFGRTRQADREGLYHVVFSYKDPEAGLYAATAAVRIAEALVKAEPYDLNNDLNELAAIWSRNRPGPSTESILLEAVARRIPVSRLDNDTYLQLGYGKNQRRVEASLAATTSAIAVDIAADKERTKNILKESLIPVPDGATISNEMQLRDIIDRIGFPLVIKPLNSNHGNGATTNIATISEAIRALKRAQKYSEKIICEQFIPGHDFRVLVVNYKFVAAALRTPASVTGDGKHNIRELIDIANADHRRGNGHDKVLTKIEIDQPTLDMLGKSSLTLNSIPSEGVIVSLKPTANLSTGGTARDVTDEVHPLNIALFERAARLVGLDICGIDVMSQSLSTRLQDNGGAILEINAAPGLRMHLSPSEGQARNVAKPIIDMLFPDGVSSRIPIIAITGTNGISTTTRLIAHIMNEAGLYTGYTTTDGVYLGNELIEEGDCSGPASAEMILRDPAVEVAVLECARGGMLRSGLGFDQCNVGVITNVASDHLGLGCINTLEQLAQVKSIVAETVSEDGTVVLNADDDHVYEMRNNVRARVALFALDPSNQRVQSHIADGRLAAVFDNNNIIIYNQHEQVTVVPAKQIPCTFDGNAEFNVANVMAAMLAAIGNNIAIDVITAAIKSFSNSVTQTPGRLNLFNFNNSKVLLDYAHNPHGLHAVGKFISKMNCRKRVGIVTGVGDRRDEDIIAMGEESARIFDEIIIRVDSDLRGRTAEEINRLLVQGIRNIDEDKFVRFFANEDDAIEFGFNSMEDNDLLAMFVDDVWKWIETVQQKIAAPMHKASQMAV
jgi:cyanophycin synthetase